MHACLGVVILSELTTIRTHKRNAKTKSVQSIMCEDHDGGSVGRITFVKFVEFMVSMESAMLLADAKIGDDLFEKFAIKDNVRSMPNSSILASTYDCLLFDTFMHIFAGFYVSPFQAALFLLPSSSNIQLKIVKTLFSFSV